MKNISYKKFQISSIIATFFGIGNIKFAPGTFGSLATFPLFLLINYLLVKFEISSILFILIYYMIILSLLFYVGYWSINIYISTNKKQDPSEVVIDEVIGQTIAYMIPMLLALYYFLFFINFENISSTFSIILSLILIICPFIFFRTFDILKPNLIGYFDKNVHGAIGIIMDDVVAGIYSGIIVIVILILFFVIFKHY